MFAHRNKQNDAERRMTQKTLRLIGRNGQQRTGKSESENSFGFLINQVEEKRRTRAPLIVYLTHFMHDESVFTHLINVAAATAAAVSKIEDVPAADAGERNDLRSNDDVILSRGENRDTRA